MVNVVFSKIAIENIRQLLDYYKDYPNKVESIKEKIDKGITTISSFPLSGKIEIIVPYSSIPCRSLVIDKNYKILYEVHDEIILILSIWDCRQNPLKLFDVFQ